MTVKKAYQTLVITVIFMMLTIIFYALNVSKIALSWGLTGFVISMMGSITAIVLSISENKHSREIMGGLWGKYRFEVLDWLTFLSVSLMGIFFVFMFLMLPSVVKYSSMSPTLAEGDRVLIYHFRYEPQEDDVVIVHISEEVYYIKRIHAIPGDRIEFIPIDGGRYRIQINGDMPTSPLNVFYDLDESGKHIIEEHLVDDVLDSDYYLVFGDNASNSIDSRSSDVGPVHIDQIVGKAFFRLWPMGVIS